MGGETGMCRFSSWLGVFREAGWKVRGGGQMGMGFWRRQLGGGGGVLQMGEILEKTMVGGGWVGSCGILLT